MAPLRALLVTAILLAGCQGATPPGPTDPFFGRIRIEPPHTGAVPSASSVAPYYSPAPPQVTLPPAMMPMPGASSVVEPNSSLVFTQSGAPIAIPEAAREMESSSRQIASRSTAFQASQANEPSKTATAIPVTIAKTPSPMAPVGSQETRGAESRGLATAAGRERIYQTISPRRRDAAASSAGPAPQRVTTAAASPKGAAPGPIDIMDLSPPSDAAQNGQANSDVQLVSAIVEIKDPAGQGTAAATPASFSQSSLYSYDPQYNWLRGRLEYSQIDRHWKLRYIPVDGVTDPFGGSVILANTDALSGYERGDFVEVRGSLASAKPDKRTFSPTFEIQTIKLVRK